MILHCQCTSTPQNIHLTLDSWQNSHQHYIHETIRVILHELSCLFACLVYEFIIAHLQELIGREW
jgi:hypothetical protein